MFELRFVKVILVFFTLLSADTILGWAAPALRAVDFDVGSPRDILWLALPLDDAMEVAVVELCKAEADLAVEETEVVDAVGGAGAGICSVVGVEVAIPMTKRLLASLYAEDFMSVPAEMPDAEKDERKEGLLCSILMRFRIICVAALNWGTYGGRAGEKVFAAGVPCFSCVISPFPPSDFCSGGAETNTGVGVGVGVDAGKDCTTPDGGIASPS